MRRFGLCAFAAIAALAVMPRTVMAQNNIVVIERTTTITIIEMGDLAQTVSFERQLPPGYTDFVPVVRPVRLSSGFLPVCRVEDRRGRFHQDDTQEAAIALGKFLWLGDGVVGAVEEVVARRRSEDCFIRSGLTLVSQKVAVRGDDKGRRVLLTIWEANNGLNYMSAMPCKGNNLYTCS